MNIHNTAARVNNMFARKPEDKTYFIAVHGEAAMRLLICELKKAAGPDWPGGSVRKLVDEIEKQWHEQRG